MFLRVEIGIRARDSTAFRFDFNSLRSLHAHSDHLCAQNDLERINRRSPLVATPLARARRRLARADQAFE